MTKVVRLDVALTGFYDDPIYWPKGTLLRVTQTGKSVELVRTKRRSGPKGDSRWTFWVKDNAA